MISLLVAAVPDNSAISAVAEAAELHIQTPSVQAIIQACRIHRLQGFAALPPNVDLVVLEEVRPVSTYDLLTNDCPRMC